MTRHTPAGSHSPVTLPSTPGLLIDTDRIAAIREALEDTQ